MTKSRFQKLLLGRLSFHLYWWGFLSVFFLLPSAGQGITEGRLEGFAYFAFMAVPIDLHFFMLHRFFKSNRLVYILSFPLIMAAGALFYHLYFSSVFGDSVPYAQSFIEVTFITVIATAVKIIKDGLKQKLHLQELQARFLQTELQWLKSQVNPHFLFNTLNNLYALSLDHSKKLPEMIAKLSNLMKYMLIGEKSSEIHLREELDFLRDYLDLEKLRVAEGSDITFDIDGDPGNRAIAPLLFIPFVENSFKHGVKATGGDFYVHIGLTLADGRLEFRVKNSKPAHIPGGQGELQPGSQLGLKNVRRRLELLYPKRHNLTIDDGIDTFTVCLEVKT